MWRDGTPDYSESCNDASDSEAFLVAISVRLDGIASKEVTNTMRITHATLIVLALFSSHAILATAQETSTPSAAGSRLAALGFPELVVTTREGDFDAPSSIEAGRYRLVIVNASESGADVELYQLGDALTLEDVTDQLAATGPMNPFPDFFFMPGVVMGGAHTEGGESAEVILDLQPGSWAINLFRLVGGRPENVTRPLHVTGSMPDVQNVPTDVTANLLEHEIDMPTSVPAGPAIWQIANLGQITHYLEIDSYPEPLTQWGIEESLNRASNLPSTPSPVASPGAVVDPGLLTELYGTTPLSAGATIWIEVNLEPGQYGVFCFAQGPGDIPRHAALGEYVIIVAE